MCPVMAGVDRTGDVVVFERLTKSTGSINQEREMKLASFAAIFGVALCGIAFASPVYLNCTTSAGENFASFEITLDESTKQVSYSILETGLTEKLAGVFTASKVVFVSDPNKLTEMQVSIDRNTLAIRRAFPKLKEAIGTDKAETGKCSIVQASKSRKF